MNAARGLALGIGLQLAAMGAAFVGLAPVVEIAFPLVAVALAARLLARRDGTAYLEFVLWLWLLSPEVRRVVDLQVGWTPVSPVMLAAPVASLLCLVPAVRGRRRMEPSIARALLVAGLAVLYGAAVGMVVVGVATPLAALLTWLPPIALGLYVATAGPASDAEVIGVLRRTALVGSLVLGVYGLVQFFFLPAWDAFWMSNAPIGTIGNPEPLEVRVFSTLNSPNPFATVLGTLLVLLAGCRGPGRWPALLAGVAGFGLSLVRTAWFGYVVALLTLLAPGRLRLLRSAVLAVAIPIAVLLSFGGPAGEAVMDRFAESVNEGDRDDSLLARVRFHTELLPEVAREVVGTGLGSVGVATKVGNDGDLGEGADFDGGALEILFTFGVVVGAAVLVTLALAVAAAWRRAQRLGDFERAMAAALVGLLVQLPLGNPVVSPGGVLLWVLLGTLARLPEADRADRVDRPPRLTAAR